MSSSTEHTLNSSPSDSEGIMFEGAVTDPHVDELFFNEAIDDPLKEAVTDPSVPAGNPSQNTPAKSQPPKANPSRDQGWPHDRPYTKHLYGPQAQREQRGTGLVLCDNCKLKAVADQVAKISELISKAKITKIHDKRSSLSTRLNEVMDMNQSPHSPSFSTVEINSTQGKSMRDQGFSSSAGYANDDSTIVEPGHNCVTWMPYRDRTRAQAQPSAQSSASVPAPATVTTHSHVPSNPPISTSKNDTTREDLLKLINQMQHHQETISQALIVLLDRPRGNSSRTKE
ncbi:hypothetical protein HD806DRAFT_547300 [Xylariaceae sp. AK1471]|nr:hypothetical protein HD806DRAFT_547300 [Xylariaceae sp. AK1471]